MAKHKAGKSAAMLGTGNPGMANIMGTLGIGWGLLVLMGDILKTVLACCICRIIIFPNLGQFAILYAGVGAVLGHNFPFWKGFHGGKGVAVTCTFLVLASPLWGGLSCAVGGIIALISGFLPLGAVLIPALFLLAAFLRYSTEAGILVLFTTVLMISRHYRGLMRILSGTEEKKLRRKKA